MMNPPSSVASSSRSIYLPANPSKPAQILTTDAAVTAWPATQGFQAFWEWTKRRCDRIKGKEIMSDPYDEASPPIRCLMTMLDDLMNWIEEIPPGPQSNQRFGNLAFREYCKLVEKRLPAIVNAWPDLPPHLEEQLLPLLIQSTPFGQPIRLDYGTGHELAFVLALWCCVAAGWIGGETKEEEDDELVLRVFPKYLELVTELQKTYNLEPAGSHGVWGLDDYCFFPYLFGSAQLLDSDVTPAYSLQNALQGRQPMTDLYTLSLHRITMFKKGAAFSEHSPMLHQLSTYPDWKKPHGGLRKWFMGEVAGKRVVAQGLWIGGWCGGDEVGISVGKDQKSTFRSAGTPGANVLNGGGSATKAPWAT